MKDEIIKELVMEQFKEEAMDAHTIRIPRELSDEIAEFCGQTGIRKATIWRKCLALGWEKLNESSP